MPEVLKFINESLAVKYRPKKLEEISGQDSIKLQFNSIIKKTRIPQAILIIGETGSGKTTLARMVARYLNCERGNACGECESCIALDNNSHPDVIEINAAADGNKEEARKLTKRALFKPIYNFRVLIVDEIHGATPQSIQAILKPLEEPPKQTIWILCTTNPEKLPDAIIGRCVRWQIERIEEVILMKFLNNILKKEHINIKNEKLKKKLLKEVVIASNCRPRDSLKILDSILMAVSGNVDNIDENVINTTIVTILNNMLDNDLGKLSMIFLLNLYIFITEDDDKIKKATMSKIIYDIKQVTDYIRFIDSLLFYNSTLIEYINYYLLKIEPKFYYSQKIWIKNFKNKKIDISNDLVLNIQSKLVDLKSSIMNFTQNPLYLYYKFLADIKK